MQLSPSPEVKGVCGFGKYAVFAPSTHDVGGVSCKGSILILVWFILCSCIEEIHIRKLSILKAWSIILGLDDDLSNKILKIS